MTRKTKWSILLFASTLLAIGFYFSDVLIARVIIAIVFCAKYLYFYFCIETIKEED